MAVCESSWDGRIGKGQSRRSPGLTIDVPAARMFDAAFSSLSMNLLFLPALEAHCSDWQSLETLQV